MLRPILISLLLSLASAGTGFAGQSGETEQAKSKPWAKYCHVRGLGLTDQEERDYLASFADRCTGADACVLSCLRSGCAEAVGGGCFHMCSSGLGDDLDGMDRARQYEDRTAQACTDPRFRPMEKAKGR